MQLTCATHCSLRLWLFDAQRAQQYNKVRDYRRSLRHVVIIVGSAISRSRLPLLTVYFT